MSSELAEIVAVEEVEVILGVVLVVLLIVPQPPATAWNMLVHSVELLSLELAVKSDGEE